MSDITKNNPAYAEIINKLPKPYSPEEQYLYSIACTVAEVPYEMPFQNAFWRKEQYLKAIWQIAIGKIQEPNIPDDGTVSTEKIVDSAITTDKLADSSITTAKIADGVITENKLAANSVSTEKIIDRAITEIKLAVEVTNKLLADDRITTSMLKDSAVTTPKIADNAVSTDKVINGTITENKLATAVVDRLLADNKITTAMLQDSSVTKAKLAQDVSNLLLAENHTGIVKQSAIAQITETGDSLTLDVVKNKINEIIIMLKSAQVIS